MAAPNSQDVTANATVVLGSSDTDEATTFVVAGTDTGWSGTVIVQGRMRGGTTWFPIPYKRRALIAAASDDTVVSATITDTAFLIEINGSGLDVRLVTTTSAGTLGLEWTAVRA